VFAAGEGPESEEGAGCALADPGKDRWRIPHRFPCQRERVCPQSASDPWRRARVVRAPPGQPPPAAAGGSGGAARSVCWPADALHPQTPFPELLVNKFR